MLPTSESREATAQLLRRSMLEALIADDNLSAEQLSVFRELCKDYEAPGRSTLATLEARIAALEGASVTTRGEVGDGTITMG